MPPLLLFPCRNFAYSGAHLRPASNAASPHVKAFRNRPEHPPGRGGDGPEGGDENREVFNPLSANEEKAYLILAGIGCLPFLLLLLLVILTHSPFMAN